MKAADLSGAIIGHDRAGPEVVGHDRGRSSSNAYADMLMNMKMRHIRPRSLGGTRRITSISLRGLFSYFLNLSVEQFAGPI